MPQLEQVDTFVSQIFWLFVSFAIIYYFISKIASPKIGDIMRKRQDIVASDLEQASKYKNETLSITSKFEEKVAKVKLESLQLTNKASSDAEASYKSGLEKADNEIKGEIESSEKEILAAKDQVTKDLSQEVSQYVEDIIQKIANVKVDKKTIDKAISSNS